jgi:SAM-dependent methyltransferase
MDWKHGYYAESGYVYGYYAETMPMRLRWAALLQGHETPQKNFRYLDAGCGQGVNLILAAAAHPESEFVGIDFMPEHIAHATQLAVASGIKNVTFIEADFLELSKAPSDHPALALPFDFVVCHGISTWISPNVRSALFSLVSKVLRPAGLFYNSFNTYPGWLGTSPLQHLVLIEQRTQSGQRALATAKQNLEKIQSSGPSLFDTLPGLAKRLKTIQTQNPAYLIQEYGNQYSQPVYCSQMHDELLSNKFSYLGSATLTDAFDSLLPEGIQALLKQQPTVLLKEQLRDYAVNQAFRRDLYVKGAMKIWPRRHKELLGSCRFICNTLLDRPVAGAPFAIPGSSIQINADPTVLGSMLDCFQKAESGLTLDEALHESSEQGEHQGMIQVISLLLQGGWILPVVSELNTPNFLAECLLGKELNWQMAKAVADGAPYAFLSLPTTGVAIQIPDTEWLLLKCHLESVPRNQWGAQFLEMLSHLQRTVSQDGKPLTGGALENTLENIVSEFECHRLPFYNRMGAV